MSSSESDLEQSIDEVKEEDTDSSDDDDEEEVDENPQLESNQPDSDGEEDDSDDESDDDEDDDSEDESDDDDESDESDESEEDIKPKQKPEKKPTKKQKEQADTTKSVIERAQEKIKEKYAQRKGKSLFLRFLHKLNPNVEALEAEIKELNPRVIKVNRPRQPSARFCLVDFASTEDCQKAFAELRKVEVRGKRIHVAVPKCDSEAFIENICAKRAKHIKEKLARKKLTKSLKSTGKSFTSTLQVKNIPTNAKVNEVKALFPTAVDFKYAYTTGKDGTNSAIVSLPTPQEATHMKKKKLQIGGNKLIISFVPTKAGKQDKIKTEETDNKPVEKGAGKDNKKNKKPPLAAPPAKKMKKGAESEVPSSDQQRQPKKKFNKNNPKQQKQDGGEKDMKKNPNAPGQKAAKKNFKGKNGQQNGSPAKPGNLKGGFKNKNNKNKKFKWVRPGLKK